MTQVQHFFHQSTSTLTYVVHDPQSRVGVVIDPVTDYDHKSGATSYRSCEAVAAYIEDQKLTVPYVLDTHAHADHMSGLPFFKDRFGARTVIGRHITTVQAVFRDIFNLGPDFPVDGSQFDLLLTEGEPLDVGPFSVEPMHTPGHTPACFTYKIGDALFVGDLIFMPDFGTSRCDFPGGSAETLYDSIRRIYALPDETRIFVCHDYQPGGRELRFCTTVGEQKQNNVQLNGATSKDAFVSFRSERDATLDMPLLILPSLQVNIRAGRFPEPEDNGTAYLKFPLNRF